MREHNKVQRGLVNPLQNSFATSNKGHTGKYVSDCPLQKGANVREKFSLHIGIEELWDLEGTSRD